MKKSIRGNCAESCFIMAASVGLATPRENFIVFAVAVVFAAPIVVVPVVVVADVVVIFAAPVSVVVVAVLDAADAAVVVDDGVVAQSHGVR